MTMLDQFQLNGDSALRAPMAHYIASHDLSRLAISEGSKYLTAN